MNRTVGCTLYCTLTAACNIEIMRNVAVKLVEENFLHLLKSILL